VLEREGANFPVEWSPDGRALIVSQAHSSYDNDLHLLDLVDGSLRHLTPHSGEAVYDAVDWAPDGRYLYLLTNQDRDRAVLARLDLADGSLAVMPEPAWEMESCRLSRDGRLLAWQTNQDGYSSFQVRDLASGRELPLPELPAGVIGDLRWAPDGRRLVFTLGAFDDTTDLWLVELDPPAALRLTRSSRGGLPNDAFLAPQLVHYPSFDGLEVPAFLFPPRARSGLGAPFSAGDRPVESGRHACLRASTEFGNSWRVLARYVRRYP
jgi:dipeptidyl aminopeptidase/acylaminoacyl peptidase